MEDKDNKARKFAIKYKGKSCEFNKTTNGREQGRVVGYNKRNGLVIVRVHEDFGWRGMEEPEYVHPDNIIINEQNVRKLSSKTSKRK